MTTNKKPIHQQLLDLKHWAQPETKKELNTGGYVDKEQRIYESLKVPGYETYEKSNVSYKKLKEKEKSTYPFDTPQGIDHFTKTVKEESPNKLSPKENKDMDILNKEMKLSVLKKEIDNTPKFEHHNPDSYPSSPEQRRRLKNIDKLEKSLGYNSQNINVPYKKDTRTPNEKKRQNYNLKQKLKNTRGPSIDPVKITEYPEVVLGSPAEVSRTTINRNDKPVELIVKELADERLAREQKYWDHRYGKGGIPGLKRPE